MACAALRARRQLFLNGFAYYHGSLAPATPHTAYCCPEHHPGLPIPEAAQIARFPLNSSTAVYELGGATANKPLDQALPGAAGKGFGDFASIRDWGVGCGRFARHFHHVVPCQTEA